MKRLEEEKVAKAAAQAKIVAAQANEVVPKIVHANSKDVQALESCDKASELITNPSPTLSSNKCTSFSKDEESEAVQTFDAQTKVAKDFGVKTKDVGVQTEAVQVEEALEESQQGENAAVQPLKAMTESDKGLKSLSLESSSVESFIVSNSQVKSHFSLSPNVLYLSHSIFTRVLFKSSLVTIELYGKIFTSVHRLASTLPSKLVSLLQVVKDEIPKEGIIFALDFMVLVFDPGSKNCKQDLLLGEYSFNDAYEFTDHSLFNLVDSRTNPFERGGNDGKAWSLIEGPSMEHDEVMRAITFEPCCGIQGLKSSSGSNRAKKVLDILLMHLAHYFDRGPMHVHSSFLSIFMVQFFDPP